MVLRLIKYCIKNDINNVLIKTSLGVFSYMRRLVTVNPYNFTNWQKFNNSYDCFLRYFLGIFYDWFYVSRACFDSSISSKVGRVLVLDRDPKLIDFKKNEYELLHKPDLTLQEYRKERVQIIVSVCNPKPIILYWLLGNWRVMI